MENGEEKQPARVIPGFAMDAALPETDPYPAFRKARHEERLAERSVAAAETSARAAEQSAATARAALRWAKWAVGLSVVSAVIAVSERFVR